VACTLIRATDRRRKYASAVQQYSGGRKKPTAHSTSSQKSKGLLGATTELTSIGARDTVPRLSSADEKKTAATAHLLVEDTDDKKSETKPVRHTRRQHRNDHDDSANFSFPRASILNSTTSYALHDVVARTFTTVNDNYDSDNSEQSVIKENSSQFASQNRPPSSECDGKHPGTISILDEHKVDSMMPADLPGETPPFGAGRKGLLRTVGFRREIGRMGRRGGSRRVMEEWSEEEQVRNLYKVAPPAELIPEPEEEEEEAVEVRPRRFPLPSILNRIRRLESLRQFVTRESMDSPESSFSDDMDVGDNLDEHFPVVDEEKGLNSLRSGIRSNGEPSLGPARGEKAHLLADSGEEKMFNSYSGKVSR
jgi:hypothetical protein